MRQYRSPLPNQRHQTAGSHGLTGRVVLPGNRIDRVAKSVASGVMPNANFWGPELLQDRTHSSQADRILIEGAPTINALRMKWIVSLHPIALAPKSTKGQTAAKIFTKGRDVGRHANQRLGTAGGEP